MVNKVGDIALLLAIASIFVAYNSLDLGVIFSVTPYVTNEICVLLFEPINSLSFITFSLSVGAVGKSAQLGLHT
jgi:NADH:ubiquinone oxidoreductase subunit 5 (subunit L)/multisubunit Na+/H+ antiporter MnhA subunit